METAMLEAQPRAGDEIAHGARHQRFAWCRHGDHAGRRVHGNSTNIIPRYLDLAGMKTAAHHQAERLYCGGNRCSAPHRASWTVEGGEKPVAQPLYLLATKPADLLAHCRIMTVEQRAPLLVAKFGSAFLSIQRCP